MSNCRVTLCTALGALALLAPAMALAQPAARADWKVGDTWTLGITSSSGVGGAARREEVRVVKEAGENGYQVEKHEEGWRRSARRWKCSPSPGTSISSRPPWAAVRHRNSSGWNGRSNRDVAYQFEINAQNQVVTWKGKVTGWQDVEVPAGKFKALHVEFERSGPFRGSASESIWYAPEARARRQARPDAGPECERRTSRQSSWSPTSSTDGARCSPASSSISRPTSCPSPRGSC